MYQGKDIWMCKLACRFIAFRAQNTPLHLSENWNADETALPLTTMGGTRTTILCIFYGFFLKSVHTRIGGSVLLFQLVQGNCIHTALCKERHSALRNPPTMLSWWEGASALSLFARDKSQKSFILARWRLPSARESHRSFRLQDKKWYILIKPTDHRWGDLAKSTFEITVCLSSYLHLRLLASVCRDKKGIKMKRTALKRNA